MAVETTEETLELKTAKDMELTKHLKYLFYGAKGGGKTWLAGEFNQEGNVLFLDFDDGISTVMGWDNVYYLQYIRTPTSKRLYHKLMRDRKKIEEIIREKEIVTVVADSFTTLAEIVLDGVMADQGKAREYVSQPEWGQQMNRMIEFITWLHTLETNVICNFHEQLIKDENVGKVWCLPLITGKLAYRIGIYFSELYHLEACTTKNGKEWKMLVVSDSWYPASSRLVYKDIRVPSSYKSIKEAIERKKNQPPKGKEGNEKT